MKMRALWPGAAIVAIGVGLRFDPILADEPGRSYPPGPTPASTSTVSYDWSGLYFGGQLGAANARNEWTNDFTLEKVGQSTTGFAGGAHAGLQKQWSWIVAGAEVSYLWMDQAGSVGSATMPGVALSSSIRDVTLVTGKFGWTWENLLATFRGGWATGEVGVRTTATGLGLLASSSGRDNGWTAGASIEYALWDHVILGAEYDYVQLNADRTLTSTPVGPLAPIHVSAGVDIQALSARLTFKFGGGWQ
jgi:outer membrane immunogenic protein